MVTSLGISVLPWWFLCPLCLYYLFFGPLLSYPIKNIPRKTFIESQFQSLCHNFESLDQHTLWSSDRGLHLNPAFSMHVLNSIGAFSAPTLALVHAQVYPCFDCLFDPALIQATLPWVYEFVVVPMKPPCGLTLSWYLW